MAITNVFILLFLFLLLAIFNLSTHKISRFCQIRDLYFTRLLRRIIHIAKCLYNLRELVIYPYILITIAL